MAADVRIVLGQVDGHFVAAAERRPVPALKADRPPICLDIVNDHPGILCERAGTITALSLRHPRQRYFYQLPC